MPLVLWFVAYIGALCINVQCPTSVMKIRSYFMSLQTLSRISLEGTKFMLKADPRKMDLKGFPQRVAEVPAFIEVLGN